MCSLMALPHDPTDTRTLIERARHGDRDAFAALIEPLRARLLATIREKMGPTLRSQTDAEDVLQETQLRALRSIASFTWQGPESFRFWLEGIASHFLLDSGRKASRRQTLELPRDPHAPSVSPSRAMRREERFERLRRSIARLSPEHREVIHLARIEGLRVEEIAERTGRTPSAVKNILFKAIRKLRESFGDTASLGLPDRSLAETDKHRETETGHDESEGDETPAGGRDERT
jgi:RNA polymerase sigma factor (sigma-70 family)